jgi:tetratricopeptide (TPR) repeat protein
MGALQILVKQAEALALAGKWNDEAIALNTRILELDDRIAGAYTRLARCFTVQGSWLAARSMYRQVLEFDSNSRIASNQLAAVEERLRDLADLELVAEIEDYAEALSIGVAARRQGNTVLSIAALRRAVELDPSAYALTAFGAAYRSNGQLAEAEAAYRRAIKLRNDPAPRVGLAAVYADRGWLAKAHELYWHVLRDDDRNIYALNGLGAVLSRRGRLEQAERCFARSAEIGQAPDESIVRLAELRAEYARRGDSAGERRVQALLDRLRTDGRMSARNGRGRTT